MAGFGSTSPWKNATGLFGVFFLSLMLLLLCHIKKHKYLSDFCTISDLKRAKKKHRHQDELNISLRKIGLCLSFTATL